MDSSVASGNKTHSISVVIPVYQAESTLGPLVARINEATASGFTRAGVAFRVCEIILVWDNGGDSSDRVIRELALESEIVRPVWLSRNFGQHAATFAGMAASTGDWVVTLDEDGQHDPDHIADFLDAALREHAQVVYGAPINVAPHGALRNAASRGAKSLSNRMLGTNNSESYNSYRLVLGSIARAVANYSGPGVYLDVSLSWAAGTFAHVPIVLQSEGRMSGYNYRRLLGHFWRLVLTSGTQGLRLVSILGIVFASAGVLAILWIVVVKLTFGIDAEGWASTIIVLLLTSGATLFSLGVIAEYIGVNVSIAMGKPAFLVIDDPEDGPLGSKH